ncbi:hypothetical protein ACGFI9_23185 [Micromonospora sp. NPDC048930]|uniref:hypothetical protein n=1 Tax=Micromonospora sp. NPDC048930 TaxID=3364261 RepID=UPI0037210930
MTTDDERVADLLRRLDDEPVGPPRIDLPGAIREARRRRRNRRVAAAGAVALGVLAVAVLPGALRGDGRAAPAPAVSPNPSAPSPKPRPTGPWQGVCGVELLPVPDDALGSEVTGGDPDGRWLVGRQIPRDLRSYRLLIWDGDRVREVELPGADQELRDVNRAGLAVGSTGVALPMSQAWAVHDGEAVRLLGISSGAARAVNDAGRIVGFRNAEEVKEPWAAPRPVVWDSYRAEAVDLPLPGPQWSGSAIDIDEDGTILGELADMAGAVEPGQPRHLVVWRPGAARPEVLPLPRVPGGTASRFYAVSLAGGWVTGIAARDLPGKPRSAAKEYAVRIDLRTGTVDVLPRVVAAGTGNGRGWLAGVQSSNSTGSIPFVVTDTKTVKLPGLNAAGGDGGWVRSLSDDGRVLGGQLFPNHQGRAVRWTCR